MQEVIPLEECRHRWLYAIRSRNLTYGAFKDEHYDNGTPVGGFIGIREKFSNEYLFTEFHYDTGAPFGTVRPLEALEPVPEEIELREHYANLQCAECGAEFPWVEHPDPPNRPSRVHERELGHHIYVMTYTPLFDWLKEREQFYDDRDRCTCKHVASIHYGEDMLCDSWENQERCTCPGYAKASS